jgi:SAM-dependent methyltransferase
MNFHDRLVDRYWSTHYHRFMPRVPQEWNYVVQRLALNFGAFLDQIPRDALVLDIPCGVGYLEHCLLRLGFRNIHAVDVSREQIEVAKAKLAEHRLEHADRVAFHVADAFEYLRRGTKYAAIAIIDMLEHQPKPRILEFMDLCHTALDESGLALIRVSNAGSPAFAQSFYRDLTHETPFTPDSLRQCLAVTGFEAIKLDYEVLPYVGIGVRAAGERVRRAIRWAGLWVLGKFLGIPPAAFAADLVAVARKR